LSKAERKPARRAVFAVPLAVGAPPFERHTATARLVILTKVRIQEPRFFKLGSVCVLGFRPTPE